MFIESASIYKSFTNSKLIIVVLLQYNDDFDVKFTVAAGVYPQRPNFG
ncbi:MAG: hypothetical protein ACKOC0_10405 [Cytophagales bacterium]